MTHEKLSACIEACHACVVACEHCAQACLREDPEMMAECIRLDRDCADVCNLAASWMARDSRFAEALCALCATVCDACGAECVKHEAAHCQACAVACRRCADECRAMVA